MISSESLTNDLTTCSCGKMISAEVDDEWKMTLVEGVEVVVPRGVFGGNVVRRRWMS